MSQAEATAAPIVGWSIWVTLRDGTRVQRRCHKGGNAGRRHIRLQALCVKNEVSHDEPEPYTQEQWDRAFGINQRM